MTHPPNHPHSHTGTSDVVALLILICLLGVLVINTRVSTNARLSYLEHAVTLLQEPYRK